MKLVTRECSGDDAGLLAGIGRETFVEAFSHLNDSAVMKRYLDSAFNTEQIWRELQDSSSSFFITLAEAGAASYLKLNWPPGQTDLNEPGSLEIQRIYVRGCYQRLGIGGMLIKHAENKGRESGCSTLWLSTWKKNEAGLKFYLRSGFSIAGEKRFAMDDEIQCDFILKKSI